jgi:hypothetical protein
MIARLEEQAATKKFDEHLSEIQTQLDEVRSRKIDPFKKMKDEPALAVAAVIEGIVKGFYEGMSGKTLPSEVDRILAMDLDAQEKNLANDRANIGEQMSMLGQQRSVFKDHQLAKMQSKNMYYEALKQGIEAESARYDSPIIAARAEQAWVAIDRQQKTLDRDIKQRAQDQARAAAAAAAAQARAARKEMIETQLKLAELGIKDKEADAKIRKEQREGMGELGKELSKPEIVNAEQTIADIKAKMYDPATGQLSNEKGIPGVGTSGDIRSHWMMNPLIGSKDDAPLGLTKEERIGRQEWNRMFDAYKVAVTGAGASEGEIENLRKSFGDANSPAEQMNAIRLADEMLQERKARIKATVDDDTARAYDARVKQERAAVPQPVPRTPVK